MLTIRKPLGTIGVMGGVMAVPFEFTWSLAQMIQFNNEFLCGPTDYVHLERAESSYHSYARNYLAARALGDWILMLDTDHAFDPDLCARMVGLTKKWNVDVLTAVYRYKVHPYLPNLFRWDEASEGYTTIAQLDWTQPLARIDCSGGGTLLVRTAVFDRIRRELGEEPFEIRPTPDGKRTFSEDFSFYSRLRELKIPAFVSPMIESHHLRVNRVTHRDFDPTGLPLVEG